VDPVTNKLKVITAAGAAVVLAAAAAGVTLYVRHRRAKAEQARAQAAQAITLGEVPQVAFWVDVHTPAAAWKAARGSPWLQKALAEPLGQGLSSGLSAFLGTRGTDLAGAFEGTVLDLMVKKLLSDPFRVMYMAGGEATGAPAFVVPDPSSAARGAFEVMGQATGHGRYQLASCPGKPGGGVEVSRWLVADHAIFAAEKDGHLALAGNPKAAAQALCVSLPALAAEKGVDLSIAVSRVGIGHEANLAAALLGVSDVTRFQFGIEGTQLVPRGIAGKLEAPTRLQAAAPSQDLLRALPGDAGFVLLATLALPEALDVAALKQHLDGKFQGKLAPRTVAVVWNPRPGERPEVAVAWPERDAKFLQAAFSGPEEMVVKRGCGHVLLASTSGLAAAMEKACGGKTPSLVNAAPAIVAGLKAPVSLGVNVNVGQVLSRALGDAWAAEHGKKPGSPEIESARRLLEELPFIGLRGVTKGDALEPGGFRS
jgi:hypothetical protein